MDAKTFKILKELVEQFKRIANALEALANIRSFGREQK